MAYDSRRGRVVLYTGYAADPTWEFDGTAWLKGVQKPNTSHGPSAMAFYPGRDRCVLVSNEYSLFDEYDGSSWVEGSTPFGIQQRGRAIPPPTRRWTRFSTRPEASSR